MIELGPGNKQGLPSANPVWVAGGMIGYGEALPRGLDVRGLGGVVVGPVMAKSRAGADLPRVAEGIGGMVVESGGQNRGITNALFRYSKLWPSFGCPVVVQVVDGDARGMGKLVARLATVAGIAGLELVPFSDELDVVARMVRYTAQEVDLPIWVKVPLDKAVAWAEPLVRRGANGLVVGQPVVGQIGRDDGAVVQGALYGPLTFALMLPVLRDVARLQLPAALIACGGVHHVAQMEAALDAGADAVQVDSALWVEPALPNWLVAAWQEKVKAFRA